VLFRSLDIVGSKFKVSEVIEKRDHAGEFQNLEHKKNSFFKVDTSFEELIPTI
jgi:hypothetical protein